MDHELELVIPILEIFGNFSFAVFYYPGNMRNISFFFFLDFSLSWKYWKLKSPIFPGSWKCGRQADGSRGCVVLPWFFWDPVPEIL